MAKRKGKKAGSKDGVNKAQEIRDTAKKMGGKVRPKDIIAALAERSITVSSAQVSTTLAAAGYRRKRRGRKPAAATATANGASGLNLDALVAAKALIQKVGSVQAAEEALKAMKKLG